PAAFCPAAGRNRALQSDGWRGIIYNRLKSAKGGAKEGRRVYTKLNGMEMECRGTERWLDLLARLPDGGAGALGICIEGRTRSLLETVEEYAYARVLTYADEEGRRIYERSLQMLFLAAARH